MCSLVLVSILLCHCVTLGKLLAGSEALSPRKTGLKLADSQCHYKDQMRSCLQSTRFRRDSGDAQQMLILSGFSRIPCS